MPRARVTPGDSKSTENHFIQGRERLRVSKNSLFRETWSFLPRVCHGASTTLEKPGHSHPVSATELLPPQRDLVISTPCLPGSYCCPRETWSFPPRVCHGAPAVPCRCILQPCPPGGLSLSAAFFLQLTLACSCPTSHHSVWYLQAIDPSLQQLITGSAEACPWPRPPPASTSSTLSYLKLLPGNSL